MSTELLIKAVQESVPSATVLPARKGCSFAVLPDYGKKAKVSLLFTEHDEHMQIEVRTGTILPQNVSNNQRVYVQQVHAQLEMSGDAEVDGIYVLVTLHCEIPLSNVQTDPYGVIEHVLARNSRVLAAFWKSMAMYDVRTSYEELCAQGYKNISTIAAFAICDCTGSTH